MSNKELLKDLLKKLLNEKLLYLEEKGKEDISSLSYTKTEFDSLGKKIETLVKLREEKIKKDKIEEEKREKEKTEKVQKKNIQPQTSRKSIGIKISPSKSNFHRKEPKQNLNTTSDFGRKTLTNTKSLGNIFGGRKSLGPNTERMSTRPSIGRDKSGGRKSIGNNLFNNNKNESIGRKSIQPLLKSSNTTTNLFGKKNTNVNKGKGNIKKNNISINNNNNVNNCSNKKICFNDLIEKDIVNNNIIPYLNDNDKLVFYSINKKLIYHYHLNKE